MTNISNDKYVPKMSRADGLSRWRFYDAQSPGNRELFQNFPIDVWPSSCGQMTPQGWALTETSYLASLRNIWGPDHPAVIDAAKRCGLRRGKPTRLATIDDLADLF